MARCFILSLGLLVFSNLASAAPVKVGERHADFILANIADGKPVALSDFRGKKVLLIQFASW